MKNGTAYATKLKKAWAKMRPGAAAEADEDKPDPLFCLATGILGASLSKDQVRRVIERLTTEAVDWNEIRVSNADDLAAIAGAKMQPDAFQRLIDALQHLYDKENALGMDRLGNMGRREARQYLESLNGMDEYAVATVMLWYLGGHAIPVNDSMLKILHDEDLVNPEASRAEVQAFLERHISAADGRQFVATLENHKSTKAKKVKTTKKKTVKKKSKKS
ncbi:MAG: hypothetical protein ACPGXK_13835 [Phycisphaerae bacterium]